jgi:hypothetical protein
VMTIEVQVRWDCWMSFSNVVWEFLESCFGIFARIELLGPLMADVGSLKIVYFRYFGSLP